MSNEINYASATLIELLRAQEELLQGVTDLTAGIEQDKVSRSDLLEHMFEMRTAVVEITKVTRVIVAKFGECHDASST